MNDARRGKEMGIGKKKARIGKTLTWFFRLRVGESDPYFGDLVRGKERVDKFDTGADKGHVRQMFFDSRLGAAPHTSALDVDANKIAVRIDTSESHSIIALTAAEFEGDRVMVAEMVAPMALEGEALMLQIVKRDLEEVRKGKVFGEMF